MKFLLITAVIAFIDQATKLFIKGFSLPSIRVYNKGMEIGESFPLIENIINITFVENPGLAFGIDFGDEYKSIITFLTLAATVSLGFYLYYLRNENSAVKFSIAVMLGGAVGNLTDRIFYGKLYGYAEFMHGKVVDFIELPFFNFYFLNGSVGSYVFNLADAAVTFGLISFMFSLNRSREDESIANIEGAA